MSSSALVKDAASFKSALARQDYSSWHSNPAPAQPAAGPSSTEESPEKKGKKKKLKTSALYISFW
jgi:transcription initiation factor TFIIE subunit beta